MVYLNIILRIPNSHHHPPWSQVPTEPEPSSSPPLTGWTRLTVRVTKGGKVRRNRTCDGDLMVICWVLYDIS